MDGGSTLRGEGVDETRFGHPATLAQRRHEGLPLRRVAGGLGREGSSDEELGGGPGTLTRRVRRGRTGLEVLVEGD